MTGVRTGPDEGYVEDAELIGRATALIFAREGESGHRRRK